MPDPPDSKTPPFSTVQCGRLMNDSNPAEQPPAPRPPPVEAEGEDGAGAGAGAAGAGAGAGRRARRSRRRGGRQRALRLPAEGLRRGAQSAGREEAPGSRRVRLQAARRGCAYQLPRAAYRSGPLAAWPLSARTAPRGRGARGALRRLGWAAASPAASLCPGEAARGPAAAAVEPGAPGRRAGGSSPRLRPGARAGAAAWAVPAPRFPQLDCLLGPIVTNGSKTHFLASRVSRTNWLSFSRNLVPAVYQENACFSSSSEND
ncbi:uncharacterized protein [Macaca fascicularis]|uniref:uncharacterized protein n=1 Tax=Macaca fascicularis TaxID=9541 RepID=UPI003D15C699